MKPCLITVCMVSAVLPVGCGNESNPGPTQASIWEETLAAAKHENFDYRGAYRRAANRDAQGLAELMKFSTKTDAAASLGHGVVLVELLHIWGDEKFARVIRSQPPNIRNLVGGLLDAGVAYATSKKLKQPIARLFPKCMDAVAK